MGGSDATKKYHKYHRPSTMTKYEDDLCIGLLKVDEISNGRRIFRNFFPSIFRNWPVLGKLLTCSLSALNLEYFRRRLTFSGERIAANRGLIKVFPAPEMLSHRGASRYRSSQESVGLPLLLDNYGSGKFECLFGFLGVNCTCLVSAMRSNGPLGSKCPLSTMRGNGRRLDS